jgi:hypothetical protein
MGVERKNLEKNVVAYDKCRMLVYVLYWDVYAERNKRK